MKHIILKKSSYSVIIEPESGGLISSLRYQNTDLLYSPQSRPHSTTGIPLYGCWPLVPFANRAFDGLLRFENQEIQLPLNDGTSTMHGFGWQNNWQVIANCERSITLQHESGNRFTPFNYRAEQTLELNENGAMLILKLHHLGDTPLPYGIGFHPWFNCDAHTKFCAKADKLMVFVEGYRPIGIANLDEKSDYSKPKPVQNGAEIALNYCEWDGEAQLDYETHSIMIKASKTLRTPVFWQPKNADFVCFEPQSHASGAPSEHAAQISAPLQILAKGESLEGWMQISYHAAHASDSSISSLGICDK